MSENNNSNNNNNNVFAEERDAQLWATAVKSARLSVTYGIKTTTLLARLAASRVLSGEDVGILATMVADDADMQAAGVKASSIRAYGAPLKRLAAVLSPSVYEALLMSDQSVGVSAADKWVRDPGMTSAKIDRALAGMEVDRADIAVRMGALIPAPDANDANKDDANKDDANKSDANKDDANKSDASKGAGDPMAVAYDALAVLTAMVKRGETTARGRRAMMMSLRVSIDGLVSACKAADRADADKVVKA